MVMDKRIEQLEQLSEIRAMMEKSSRFISLSGLSGIAAGLIATLGVIVTYSYLGSRPFEGLHLDKIGAENYSNWGMGIISFLISNALVVFGLAALIGIFFTRRTADKKGQKIWGAPSKRLLVNGVLPLAAGGIFCLALIQRGDLDLLLPSSLIFYGLACINASKYTVNDILYLGICTLILGCIGLFIPQFGIELWALGFGALHIAYGATMYKKYESS